MFLLLLHLCAATVYCLRLYVLLLSYHALILFAWICVALDAVFDNGFQTVVSLENSFILLPQKLCSVVEWEIGAFWAIKGAPFLFLFLILSSL